MSSRVRNLFFLSLLTLFGCSSEQNFNDGSRTYGEPTARPIPNELIIQYERVEERDAVDILFVVDDSCSMANDQNKLAMHLPTLAHELFLLDMNYRVAFTTITDHFEDFPLRELPSRYGVIYWIEDDTPAKRDLFVYGATPGTSGGGPEAGFAAAYNVFGRPGGSQGFMRPNSSFHIITITDEPDQSEWTWYNKEVDTPRKFVNQLNRVREFNSFSIIGGVDAHYTHGNPGAYEKAARLSDGHIMNLDGDDWDAFLIEFANAIEVNPEYPIKLTHIPADPTDIKIIVCEDVDQDDKCVPWSTEEDITYVFEYGKPDWSYTYDPQTNFVYLEETERPLQDGDYLEIRYEIPTGTPFID